MQTKLNIQIIVEKYETRQIMNKKDSKLFILYDIFIDN